MSMLEDRIMEKVRQLDESQQERLLQVIDEMQQPQPFNFGQWMREVKALHEELRADGQLVNVQDLLDNVREEASWPRW